jgi:4-amino-4-deoxy-L-arabinose transferase-like glycosyltransferase
MRSLHGITDRQYTIFDWILVGGLALAFRLAFWFFEGTEVIGDSNKFLRECVNFSLVHHVTTKDLIYSGFFFPYCGFINLPGGTIDGWIAIQVFLSAVSCVLLYDIGRRLMNRYAGLIAGVALAVTWQGFHYIHRPQSQVFFTVIVVTTLWLLVRYRSEPTRRNRHLAFGAMGYMAFTRPNGVAFVAGFALLDFVFRQPRYRLDLFFSRLVNGVVFGVVGILALLRLQVFSSNTFLPIQFWSRRVIVTGHIQYPYALQEVPTALSYIVSNGHHIVAMAVLRLVWFLIPILPGWSLSHILLNLLTLAPLTVCAVVAIPHVIREETEIAKICLPPLAMTLLIVMLLWVPGPRKFLGPIIAIYGLLTGYLLTEHPLTQPLRSTLRARLPSLPRLRPS